MNARKARAPAKIDNFAPQSMGLASKSQSPTDAPLQSVGKMQPIGPHSSEVPQQMPGAQGNVPRMAPTPASRPPQMQSQSNSMILPQMPDAPMVDIDWVSPRPSPALLHIPMAKKLPSMNGINCSHRTSTPESSTSPKLPSKQC